MRQHNTFSAARWWSIVLKEFLQLRRDRVTFAMIVGIPILQMALFGYAINTNPKHLDTAIINADSSDLTRSFTAALQNSSYFRIVAELPSESAAREALTRGQVLFVVTFRRDLPGRFCVANVPRCSSRPTPAIRLRQGTLWPRWAASCNRSSKSN